MSFAHPDASARYQQFDRFMSKSNVGTRPAPGQSAAESLSEDRTAPKERRPSSNPTER